MRVPVLFFSPVKWSHLPAPRVREVGSDAQKKVQIQRTDVCNTQTRRIQHLIMLFYLLRLALIFLKQK